MANSDQEKKIQEEILKIKQLISKLSQQDRDSYERILNSLDKSKNTLYDFEKLTNQIRDEVDEISNSLRYIQDSFKDSVNELQKQNAYLNAQKSALNKLSDIAKNILNIRRGDSDLDTKKLAKLRLETKERIAQLEFSKRRENITQDEIEAINRQIKDAESLFKSFDKVLEVNKEINKQLGAFPALAGGIDKALSKLGLPELGFKEALDETRRLGQEADSVGNKNFSAWKTYTGIIWNNFKGIFTTANLIQAAIGFLIDALKSVDSGVGELAKGLDMSYNSANNLRMELTDIANSSGDVAVNTKGLQESLLAVGTQMGINARLSAQDLVTFTKLREQAGYTNDELVAIQKISTINNKTVGDTSKAFLGTVARLNAQNKLAINAKQLFKEIVNVSDAIKLSVGGTAEKIAEAAFKAKQFGITLQQADSIAESLLNFESSIANELSAELITGKDLNFERARLLAINGDIAGASEEILKQVKGSAEFTAMNRIQQEAIAKAVGMSRDDLAKSLVDREAAAKLGAAEGQAAQDRYNELVKIHGVEKANAMLGDKALARQFQQQSVQERFTNAVEKLKEVFVSLVEPLMPVFDIFADIMGFVGPIVGFVGTILKYTIQWGKYLLPIIAAYKTFQITSGIVLGIQAAYNNEKAFEYLTTQKTLAAKMGEKTYNFANLLIEKARNSILLKNLFLKREENVIGKKGLVQSIGSAVMAAVKGLAGLGPLGLILGLAAAGTVAALGYKFMKGDDVMSEGGYGNRTLLTPKGSIALNNNDTVIAGTNLGGKGNPSPTPAPQQDLSPLLNEMKALRQEQAKSNSKPTVVENSMNGTKFGTSVAMNTYKIQ